MSKKIYEPGEMFREAFLGGFPSEPWSQVGRNTKAQYARQEKCFFELLSQQWKEDEQTDDNPGVPVNDYPHD